MRKNLFKILFTKFGRNIRSPIMPLNNAQPMINGRPVNAGNPPRRNPTPSRTPPRTPPSAPNNGGGTRQQNSAEMVQAIIGMSQDQLKSGVWINLVSGKLYRVTRVEDASRNDGPGARNVSYMSVGDTRGFQLPVAKFALKYRQANVEELFQALTVAMRNQMPTASDGEESGFLMEPDHRHDWARILVFPETREAINIGINKILRRDQLEAVWGISAIEPRVNRSIMNFYGPPGTGKTLTAMALAAQLEKKVYQVDYSQVISKYVGDTAKHIKGAFDKARELDAILFFDEADSLLSKRVDMAAQGDASFATSINQNRNVLMQELDRFNGIVIMATNFFCNYDEAMLRRIAQHVPFKLPDREMRAELFKLHIPRHDRVVISDVEWQDIAAHADNFSGGDILNAVVNAINRVSLEDNIEQWRLTKPALLQEVQAIKEAKRQHSQPVRGTNFTVPPTIPAGV